MTDHDPQDDYDDEPKAGRLTTEQLVGQTASALWHCGVLQLGSPVFGTVVACGVMVDRLWNGQVAGLSDLKHEFRILGISALGLALGGLAVYGADQMGKFRRYPWAVVGTLVGMVSLPCIILVPATLPLGVWALILLCRGNVRARFRDGARGTMTPAPAETPDARAD